MSIITLITDWGTDGSYVGAMKGAILSMNQNLSVVDIAHNIKPYDKIHTAYVLRNCYALYPKGTIHLVGVGGNLDNMKSEFIAFENEGHYFIGKNDGMWGLVFDELPKNIFAYSDLENNANHGFPELSIFPKIIDTIIKTQSVESIGNLVKKLFVRHRQLPTVNQNVIIGEVVYFDIYGNAVTNISKDDFERVHNARNCKIHIASLRNIIYKINDSYDQTERGEILAIWGYSGFLEVAIANGSAKDLLNLSVSNSARITFIDSEEVQTSFQASSTLF